MKYGSLSELDFLKRIYNLSDLPSFDSRYENAASDIWCHTVLNDDYPECWVFEDERFNLLNGTDEELLKFLCAVFHPAVRVEMGYWKEFLAEINSLLNADGYELYAASKISGKLNDIGYKLEQGKMLCSTDIVINRADVECIGESGLKKLISEAVQYYSENNKRLAVEKLWDAFERMKTYYYPELDKAKSADRLIENMSGNSPEFKKVYEEEFRALTKIGNDFRIRHHETNRTDIVDDRQYDYFYQRCLALISVAILYL